LALKRKGSRETCLHVNFVAEGETASTVNLKIMSGIYYRRIFAAVLYKQEGKANARCKNPDLEANGLICQYHGT
jgi:hypothetical protein